MDAKQFAEENAGKQWLIKATYANFTATIVGYIDGQVVGNQYTYLALEDPDNVSVASGPISGGYRIQRLFPVSEIVSAQLKPLYYTTILACIQPVIIVLPVIVPAYPDSCKKCKAPARKVSGNVLCSNTHCKSRSKFKAAYKSVVSSTVPINNVAELKSGRRIFFEVWEKGGCILCGWSDRDQLGIAHSYCFGVFLDSATYASDHSELCEMISRYNSKKSTTYITT